MPDTAAAQISLPVEADANRVSGALMHAHDAVERIVWALRPLADALDRGEYDMPRVELEHLAALAIIRDDLDHRVDELHAFQRRLVRGIGDAITIRAEQTGIPDGS